MTTSRPTIGYNEAMKQAGDTAAVYFKKAIRIIDKEFGDGYAKKNPNLVHSLVSAQAADFNSVCSNGATWEVAEKLQGISSALYEVSENMNE